MVSSAATPRVSNHEAVGCANLLQPSHLPRIAESERGHAAGVLVKDQGAGDRRLGSMSAVLACAEPAVDADRRALGFFQIHSGGVDQTRRMANFTAEPNCKTRLRLSVRARLAR